MAGWPASTDLETWLSGQSVSASTLTDRIPFAFDAALAVVQDDVDADLMPDDASVPNSVRLAVLILAHRLLTRADSPSGVIGFAEFAVRVGREDPDYIKLMGKYTLPGIA